MDIDLAWKRERQANAISLDGGNPNGPDGIRWISDDDLFPFPSRDDEH